MEKQEFRGSRIKPTFKPAVGRFSQATFLVLCWLAEKPRKYGAPSKQVRVAIFVRSNFELFDEELTAEEVKNWKLAAGVFCYLLENCIRPVALLFCSSQTRFPSLPRFLGFTTQPLLFIFVPQWNLRRAVIFLPRIGRLRREDSPRWRPHANPA